MRWRASGVGLAVAWLGALVVGGTPALAGVGLAVVPDFPSTVKVGQSLAGNLTITNVNTAPDDEDSNIVLDIALTPSELGVLRIDSPAIGRAGTECADTMFTVTMIDLATGEVAFDPPAGLIRLGAETAAPSDKECIIDFTFRATGTQGSEVTVHAGAHATTEWGRPGVGGGQSTLAVE